MSLHNQAHVLKNYFFRIVERKLMLLPSLAKNLTSDGASLT